MIINTGSENIWLWVVIESKDRKIIGMRISKERNMYVIAQHFLLASIIEGYCQHTFLTDGNT
jgi:putative transposase